MSEDSIERLERVLTEHLAHQDRRLDEISHSLSRALHGSGDIGNPGIVVRLDRLEQRAESSEKAEDNRRNWNIATWGAIAMTAAAETWNWLFRSGKS